ncbi:MAG: FkbM family methyltransferase [Cyanobacteria bacterium P01_H01_bin.21]
MIVTKIKTLLRPLKNRLRESPDLFLKDVSGIVHIGANLGQERELYYKCGLDVLWIEPIPDVFSKLIENIKDFKDQRAIQALVTDIDNKEYKFNIANNNGASSSILGFKQHKDIWPNVKYTNTILLKSLTLATLFQQEQIDASKYQALIMDTQGSELLVLKGSLPVLKHFQFIKTEVPDFESYEGCCQLSDIKAFMLEHGYKEISRKKFASHTLRGNYFDIIYQKI